MRKYTPDENWDINDQKMVEEVWPGMTKAPVRAEPIFKTKLDSSAKKV